MLLKKVIDVYQYLILTGSREGEFNGSHGITIDIVGNLYVCDTGKNRIIVY